MEIKKNNSIDKKTEFAFSAMMFFAPLIKISIKENQNLSQDDKIFISGYIKFGYINIILLLIAIVLGIIQFSTGNVILQKISIGVLILLASLLAFGTVLVALGKNVNFGGNVSEGNVDFNKLFYFIPVYNIYLRYKNHQFEGENSMIKCGIFLRSIFVLFAIFVMNLYINIIILIVILFIIVCNVCGINFGTKWNNFFNKIFFKNPEEIRGYLAGALLSLCNKKGIKQNVSEQKKQFEFLFKTDNKQIILEYVLLGLTCICGMFVGIKYGKYFLFVGDVFIILRYFTMMVKWGHLPHLPIFRGISAIFFRFNKKTNE